MVLVNKLMDLVFSGTILTWKIEYKNDEGIVYKEVKPSYTLKPDIFLPPDTQESPNRNTECLTLIFPNGQILSLETFCSGSLENTGFFLRDSNNDIQPELGTVKVINC